MPEPRDEVVDPSTSPARLFELATSNPELAPLIAAHPNAYPELRAWAARVAPVASAAEPVTPATPVVPAIPAAVAAASAPAAPAGPAPTSPAAPAEGPRRTRRGLVIGIAAGVVALLVIAGGGAWWFFSSRLGGASSPTAAVEKLVSSVQDVDPVGLYGSFAPSEVGELQTAFQKLADAHPKNGVDTTKTLGELHDALKVSAKDLRFRTTKIADGVERVTWTSGSITVSGSEKKVADALFSAYEPALRASLKQSGRSASSIDESVAGARRSLEHSVTLPQTLRANDTGDRITVVTVQEGSGWYISPMLTAADYWAQSVGRATRNGAVPLGDEVVEARHFSSPEEAASDLAKAVVRQDTDEMASDLALPERRLLSIYGPVWERLSGSDGSSAPKLTLEGARFAAKVDGDHASVTMKGVTVSSSQWNDEVSQNLTTRYALSDTCLTYDGEYAADDGGWDDWTGDWQSDYRVEHQSGHGCLSDSPVLRRLGVDDMSIQAVKEDGGWLISPVATLGDALSIATTNFLKYQDEGRLSDLFRQ